MTWEKEIEELNLRRELAKQMGGKEGIAKQHARGRLTIRERAAALLDAGSFQEQGKATASPEYDDDGNLLGYVPANYLLGFGRIEGRPVVVGGEDFTLRGGSPNAAGLRKSVYAEHMAVQYRMPLVRFLEGGGGSVRGNSGGGGRRPAPVSTEAVYSQPRFKIMADAMGQVPVVSAALGAVAGFPAGRLVASHFSVMTRHTSQVLIGGPALVERALGRDLTKEELGGAQVHAYSGVVDNIAEDEYDALQQIRQFLSYLPRNVWELPERQPCNDDPSRAEEELATIVPRDSNAPFEMRRILELVMDKGSVFEMSRDYGMGVRSPRRPLPPRPRGPRCSLLGRSPRSWGDRSDFFSPPWPIRRSKSAFHCSSTFSARACGIRSCTRWGSSCSTVKRSSPNPSTSFSAVFFPTPLYLLVRYRTCASVSHQQVQGCSRPTRP